MLGETQARIAGLDITEMKAAMKGDEFDRQKSLGVPWSSGKGS